MGIALDFDKLPQPELKARVSVKQDIETVRRALDIQRAREPSADRDEQIAFLESLFWHEAFKD